MRGIIGFCEEHDLHLIKAKLRFLHIPNVGKTLVELFPDAESDREWPEPVHGEHPDRMPQHGSLEWREMAEFYDEFDYERLTAIIRQQWAKIFSPAMASPVLTIEALGFTLDEWNATYANTVWDEGIPQNWD